MAKTWPDPVRLVSVAVPVPFLDVLTYQVPDGVPPPSARRARRRPAGQASRHRHRRRSGRHPAMPGRPRQTRSKTFSKCWTTRHFCRARGRSCAVGGGVLRVRRGRCPGRGRPLDAGPQNDSHRGADRARTRRDDRDARAPEGGRRSASRRAARDAGARAERERHLDRCAAATRRQRG